MSRNNKIHSSGSQHDEIMSSSNNSGKLIITIGPQCAGKTTYLSSRSIGGSSQGRSNTDQSLPPIMDVCLDDQKGIYHTCPIDIFLNPSSNNNNNNDDKNEVFLKQDLYGKSVRERLTQPNMSEMRIVLECIKSLEENPEKELNRNELMKSFSDISSSIRNDFLRSKLEFPNDLLRDMVDALISVSKDLVLKEKQKNGRGGKMKLMEKEVVDLFVVEAIFREPDKALDKAIDRLKNEIMMSVGDVAWGNTNTRPREYEKALEFAQLSNRSVHFVVFDVSSNNNNNNNTATQEEQEEERDACGIQKIINRKQLLERNICRFCKTGRYIEVKSIDSAISRVSDLTRAALTETSKRRRSKKGNTNNELYFDQALASLAGFEMDNDRKIVRRFGDAKDLQQQQQRSNNQRGGGGGRRRPSSPSRGRRPSNNNYREGGGRGGNGHQGRGGPPRSYNNRNNNERWNYDNRRDNRGGSRRDDNDNYNRNYDNNRRHNQNNNDRNWNNRNNGGGYNNRNDYIRDNDEDQRKRSRNY